MKYLFVKSDKIGSKIIRWGLKSQSSHFAVCFDEDMGPGCGIVFHSYGSKGTHLLWLSDFLQTYQVVYAVEPFEPTEESVYRAILSQDRGQGYDFKALLWWAWRGFLARFFGIPIPSSNSWQQNGYALCTKLAEGPLKLSGMDLTGIDFEMISPDALYKKMIDSGQFTKNLGVAWQK